MASKMKTAREMFYSVEDVMRLLGYSRSKSYKVISDLNKELTATGICTCNGRVSQKYLERRYGLDEPEPSQKTGRRASA